MGFITAEDYKVFIKGTTLQAVTDAGEAEIGICENIAQAEITSYLRHLYNMGEAFGKSGTDRHPLLVMYMVDITLYHLHSRIPGRQVPQTRIDRYNIAKDWLERAAEQTVTTDLPPLLNETTGKEASQHRSGGLKKFNSDDY